jgi:hypothetical protein
MKVISLVVAAVSVLCYVNSLDNSFVHDDHYAVVDNADVNSALTPWTALLVHDYWGQDILCGCLQSTHTALAQSHSLYLSPVLQ